jgi:signal transduction histidine kinase
MELSSFIGSHREAILAEWEKDARRRVVGERDVSLAQLRDHLGELLDSVAINLRGPDRGASRAGDRRLDDVAEKHGAGRARLGMTLKQVVSEFPILRSSVVRLWLQSQRSTSAADLESLIRFDEAIDRALTESASEFMDQVDRSRSTLLGILGHDLRDPLSTVISGGQLLLEGGLDEAMRQDIVERIVATGERMHHLVGDLLDATRSQLDARVPLERHHAELGETVRNIVREFATAHPERRINLTVSGDSSGEWDDKRLGQAVANIISNAIRFSERDRPVDVSLETDHEVRIAIHNDGPAIPAERRPSLFDPFVSGGSAAVKDRQRLGLGLYIAKATVDGHGGHIAVDSTPEHGTTFTIHLPRDAR